MQRARGSTLVPLQFGRAQGIQGADSPGGQTGGQEAEVVEIADSQLGSLRVNGRGDDGSRGEAGASGGLVVRGLGQLDGPGCV